MAQSSTQPQNNQINVVICGGGIIGVCTAYYLAQRPNVTSITIIERYKIAGCASGKAGGFLAKDWCDGGHVQPLARKSFALHSELAKKYGNKYGYRQMDAYSMRTKFTAIPLTKKSKYIQKYNELHWIDCQVTANNIIGKKVTNAQIHPKLFCETIIDLIKDKINIKYGIVTRMRFDNSNQDTVNGVEYIPNMDDNANDVDMATQGSQMSEEISCNYVVIALGPWSKQSFQWFPECKHLQYIASTKHNSVVIKPTYSKINDNDNDNDIDMKNDDNNDNNPCMQSLNGALFLNHKQKNGKDLDIEAYPRPDGTIYACGSADKIALPDDPSTIKNDEFYSIEIYNGLKDLSYKLTRNSKLIIKQACYLPTSADNIPLIGQITGYRNAFIGTGHTCWGILNSPATGLILSELIVDGTVSAITNDQLKKFSPSRSLFST